MIFRALLSGQRAALWYVVLAICLPLLTLIVSGAVYLWQQQWLVPVTMIWLLITLVGYLLYRLWPERRLPISPDIAAAHPSESDKTSSDNSIALTDLPVRLEERSDWTPQDRDVWLQAVVWVENTLAEKPTWEQLPELGINLLTRISRQYHRKSGDSYVEPVDSSGKPSNETYRFTLPEMLLVLAVTSDRYRQLLLSHVPFAERIKISALLGLYSRQDQIKTGAGWINTARRTARLANPLAALSAELRDQFTQRIFTNLSEKVQRDLKRLLLQELVQVGMDLYSGRLKSSADELLDYHSRSHADDLLQKATQVEPLRVVLLGQVSAGKSSLINVLVSKLEAETDILPSTDRTTVHALNLPGDSDPVQTQNTGADVHLIDTPGLVDNDAAIQTSMVTAQQADLLIWVSRATQPAKAPDAALHSALQQLYRNEPHRRQPPILLVVSHVDQLSPKSEWQPPYDLSAAQPKSQNIKRAVDSCRRQIGLAAQVPSIPVALPSDRTPYNVDVVIAQIVQLRSEAVLAQFNRRRLERDQFSSSWGKRWEQASRLGTVTGKLLTRSVLGD